MDRHYLQSADEHSISYSREIREVGENFILEHDRGYSGEKPHQITHQGIDDALPGAD